jgi:hypothetical protein
MAMRRSFARLLALLLTSSAPAVFAADPKPVAQVGSETVSSAALSRRLARIPEFQRAALGDTPDKLKRKVLESLIIPDLLYAAEAARLKLDDRPSMREREREILRQAMDHELRAQTARLTPVTPEDIKVYF